MNISYVSAQQSFFIENFIAFLTNFACICFVNMSHMLFTSNLVLELFAAKFTDNNLNGVHKLIVSVKLLLRGENFFAFLTTKLSIMFLLALFLFYIWLFQDVSLVFLF